MNAGKKIRIYRRLSRGSLRPCPGMHLQPQTAVSPRIPRGTCRLRIITRGIELQQLVSLVPVELASLALIVSQGERPPQLAETLIVSKPDEYGYIVLFTGRKDFPRRSR